VQEINVSRAGDPVHAGDKALTLETPAQRVRVNRYVFIFCRSLFVLLLLVFALCVLLRFTDSGYLQTLLSSLHIFSIS
jgi:hypothetical protein